jgi:4-hydroxy-tetrahydrodipicolinate reductase
MKARSPLKEKSMSDMRLVVVGAAGRMGQALVRAILRTSGVMLSAAIEREGSAVLGQDAGLLAGSGASGVLISDDPLAAFVKADGVLDFTIPVASVGFAALAAQARLVHVIGTTGFTDTEFTKLQAASRHAVIIQSGNMGLGVNVLAMLVKCAAKALGSDYDIEIVEMHHRMKIDAPSGTALLLGEAAAKGRGIDLVSNSTKARDGHHGARREGEIGFASLRGGTVAGEHSVILAGPGERITLSHSAESRDNFANGAVKAALWGRGRKPGYFSMTDVLGLDD